MYIHIIIINFWFASSTDLNLHISDMQHFYINQRSIDLSINTWTFHSVAYKSKLVCWISAGITTIFYISSLCFAQWLMITMNNIPLTNPEQMIRYSINFTHNGQLFLHAGHINYLPSAWKYDSDFIEQKKLLNSNLKLSRSVIPWSQFYVRERSILKYELVHYNFDIVCVQKLGNKTSF